MYQEALEKQFVKDSIPYEREKGLKIQFAGEQLKKTFTDDYVCYDKIIVELKAASFYILTTLLWCETLWMNL